MKKRERGVYVWTRRGESGTREVLHDEIEEARVLECIVKSHNPRMVMGDHGISLCTCMR